jgi:hypothetical protein
MADIRQNADVFGGLTVAGGGALYPFSIYGDSSGNGSSPYLQLQVIDQTNGGLFRINNQSSQLLFEVATDGVEIGSAYTLPFSAPSVNQILTRASGAGPGVLSWQDFPDQIGGYDVDLNGAPTNGQALLFDTSDSTWYNGPSSLTSGLGDVTSVNNVTTDSIKVAGLTIGDPFFTFPTADGTNQQILITNGSGQLSWGDAPTPTVSVADLTDTTGSAFNGAILQHNGVSWASTDFLTALSNENLGALGDVDTTTSSSDDSVLMYNSSNSTWEANPLSTITNLITPALSEVTAQGSVTTDAISTGGLTSTGNIITIGTLLQAGTIGGNSFAAASVFNGSGTFNSGFIYSTTNSTPALFTSAASGTSPVDVITIRRSNEINNSLTSAITFNSPNTSSADTVYARIYGGNTDTTVNSEDGVIVLAVKEAGTDTVRLAADKTGVQINDSYYLPTAAGEDGEIMSVVNTNVEFTSPFFATNALQVGNVNVGQTVTSSFAAVDYLNTTYADSTTGTPYDLTNSTYVYFPAGTDYVYEVSYTITYEVPVDATSTSRGSVISQFGPDAGNLLAQSKSRAYIRKNDSSTAGESHTSASGSFLVQPDLNSGLDLKLFVKQESFSTGPSVQVEDVFVTFKRVG